MSTVEKKAAQDAIQAYTTQAEQYAGQVQDGEKAISLLERLRDEKIRMMKDTGDAADVTAMVTADDEQARKQMKGFVDWANSQEIILRFKVAPNNYSDGSSAQSLIDQLTRSNAAQ